MAKPQAVPEIGAAPPVVVASDAFEQLLAELSAAFISLPDDRMDGAIDAGLRRIVAVLGIDRCSVNRLWPDTGQWEITHSVAIEGIDPILRTFSPRELLPWAFSRVMAGEAVVFSRLADLPPEADVDRPGWVRAGLRSHVSIPMLVAGKLQGALSFGSVRRERTWPAELLERLHLLAEMFAGALARKLAHDDLERALGFERLATRLLAAVILTEAAQGESEIERGLREIAQFLGVERATLWQRVAGRAEFRKTHRWLAQASSILADQFGVVAMPWISARLIEGEVVCFTKPADLPAAAAADLPALQSLGLQSVLMVPISSAGAVVGALSVATVGVERHWPTALIPGLRLLAEAFASLNARRSAERTKRAAELEAVQWRERLAHLVRVHTVGEMSAALAHEITQPLGAIENYALAAKRRAAEAVPDLPKIAELLDKVVAQATRAGDVVMRLRGMVKRHDLELKELDVARTVSDCVDMLRTDCEFRDIRVELVGAGPLPEVVADEIHVQQVILNLLRNAIEAMADRSMAAAPRVITVTTRPAAPGGVLVQVADRGPGIADGELERVFESFYSSKPDGLGVGLAISRKLIEALGGALWASPNPGGGALFQFTLPAAGD